MEFIDHPLVKKDMMMARVYQETIVDSCREKNSLIVLPTGLGKTIIAALLTVYRLQKYDGKVIFLAPTKPLVMQHFQTFSDILNIDKMEFFTGIVAPSKRKDHYEDNKIIFATPQVIENDIISRRLDLENVSMIVFDEAHRSTGDYAYVFIANKYMEKGKDPLTIGLTASPGSQKQKIKEVLENLFIENIEVRTDSSPDIKRYIQDIDIDWIEVDFPEEYKKVRKYLEKFLERKLKILHNVGFLRSASLGISKKDLLELGVRIRKEMNKSYGRMDKKYFIGIMAQSSAIKIHHGMELLETQGIIPFLDYFERLKQQKTKSAKEIINSELIKKALNLAKTIETRHPKYGKLREIVEEKITRCRNIIVFSQYRDSARKIVDILNTIEGVRAIRFVGQSSKVKDKGLTQKKQKEILEKFRSQEYNVLVATSIAEEGLDIPGVDLVLFFEPVPSEIRTIQRRGRTGRRKAGKVIVLFTGKTRDEAYFWVSRAKEKKMHKLLSQMKNELKKKEYIEKQTKIEDFVKIIVDYREKSPVVKYLSSHCLIEQKNLPAGDYLLSERVCVERKSCEDFLRSLMDRKLFQQVKNISESYEIPILIIEGENLYSQHGISANAILNAIISIILDFNVHVIFTKDPYETMLILLDIAKREQQKEKKDIPIRGNKRVMDMKENQRYIIEGLPHVSATLAERLLNYFGSVKNVFTASKEELMKVKGIGEKTAEEIIRVIEEGYE
ncbi:MAG: DEAD/DEAH box helicase family protein [Methanomicrobia archaeon]|nr:DEAD/DEAH box helicase family protein [Methanomicrobia archaeon]